MLKKFFGLARHDNKCSGRKNDVRGAHVSVDFSQSRDISVRIVHAGGKEELYQNSILVSHLLEKYPGMCVARPEVFTNPDESLLWPEDRLLPGQKYYIIPSSTVQKLKHRHRKSLELERVAEGREDMSDARITWDISGENLEKSVYSAKKFYATEPSNVPKVPKQSESKHSQRSRRYRRIKKPFVPPLPRRGMLRESGWEPSLASIQELSP